jgi:hypothetical protein
MHLLQSGVDITVIALWLGHESPVTTHAYVEADLTIKNKRSGRSISHQPRPSVIDQRKTSLPFWKAYNYAQYQSPQQQWEQRSAS